MAQSETARRTKYGIEASQFVEWLAPVGPQRRLLAVAIHGGYWRARYNLDHLRPFCTALAASGFAVASLEYRRLGEPGGGWPGTLDDVAHALHALPGEAAQMGIAFSRVLLVGHSAGGQLALWGVRNAHAKSAGLTLAGVVGLAAVSDLVEASRLNLSGGVVREFLGGSPEQVPERYRAASPVELLPLGVPTILVHGTEDEDVPYALSPAYAQKARAAGDEARLVRLEGGGHFDVIEPTSRHWPTVLKAIESLA